MSFLAFFLYGFGKFDVKTATGTKFVDTRTHNSSIQTHCLTKSIHSKNG